MGSSLAKFVRGLLHHHSLSPFKPFPFSNAAVTDSLTRCSFVRSASRLLLRLRLTGFCKLSSLTPPRRRRWKKQQQQQSGWWWIEAAMATANGALSSHRRSGTTSSPPPSPSVATSQTAAALTTTVSANFVGKGREWPLGRDCTLGQGDRGPGDGRRWG